MNLASLARWRAGTKWGEWASRGNGESVSIELELRQPKPLKNHL